MIPAVNRPIRIPEKFSSTPTDLSKPLLEKIRILEKEIRDQSIHAKKYCITVSYEEGRRTYRYLKKQESVLYNLMFEYFKIENEVPLKEEISTLIMHVRATVNFIGQDVRRKKTLNGKQIAISISKKIPKLAFITFCKNGQLYRYGVRSPNKVTSEDIKRLLELYLRDARESLTSILANLSGENGWHKLELPGVSEELLYHITLSPREISALIGQGKFAQVEEYIKEEHESLQRIKLEYVFKTFTPQEKNIIFEKAKHLRTIGSALILDLDFSDPKILQSALRFALDGFDSLGLIELLMRFPQCTIENPLPTDLLWLVRFGAFFQVNDLLKRGFSLDVKMTVYHPDFGTQRRCINSALLLLIRSLGVVGHSNIYTFIKLLTTHGLDLNKSAAVFAEPFIPLELLVFDFHDEKDYHRLVRTYLECGARPTPNIQRFWLARSHLPEYRFYIDYMKSHQLLSDEEYQIITKPQRLTLGAIDLNKVIQYRSYLQKMALLAHLNRSALDLNKIHEIHTYKKELKNHCLKNPNRIGDIYRSFCKAYDKVVKNHVLLSELREISRDFRKQIKIERKSRQFALRTISFIAAWHFALDKEMTQSRLQAILPMERKEIWNNCYRRVLDAAERLKKDKYLSRHQITWLHGTKSSSLPCFLKLKQILSMGDLLAQDIVTFSGEHCGSDRDNDHKINKDNISGEKPSRTWEDGQGSLWYSAPTRTMLTRYYAENVHNATNTLNFDEQEALERISVQHAAHLLGVKDFYRRHGVFVRTRFDVLRLRSIGAKVDNQLAKLKEFLELKIKEIIVPEDISDVQLILDAISKPLVMTFDQEDLKYMMDPKPYGIVFGSTKINSTPYTTPPHTSPHEYLVKSPIHFKKDIQVAFTAKDKVEELKQKLHPFGIKVYDFELAMVQELINMIINSRCETFSASLTSVDLIAKGQLEFAHELQLRILPEYATPYPRNPSYKKEKKVRLDDPFYEEYQKRIEEGQGVARLIHGPMHSARGAIWNLLFHRLGEMKDQHPICKGTIFQKAFSFHDIMRQNEGKDYWDKSSARYYYTHRIVSDPSNINLTHFTQALEFKDPPNGQFFSDLHQDIHDADVVEMYPRALFNRAEFREEELCFFKRYPDISKEFKDGLLNEIFAFNTYTNVPKLHFYMETRVKNYYAELMRLLHYLNERWNELPLLNIILDREIAAFADKEVDSGLRDFIDDQKK